MPARRWVLNVILTTLFEPFPAQLRDRRRRSKLRRKWSRKVVRQPLIPAPLDGIDAGGLRLSRTPSFAAIGENSPQNAASAAMVQVGGTQKELGNTKRKGKKEHVGSSTRKWD